MARKRRTLAEENRMEYNKEARKKYDKANFKYQSVKFKIAEIEAIDQYCKENNIPKNTLLREACMNAIGKSIDEY